MSGKRVLVIDDEVEFGRYVGQVATDLGLDVEVTLRPEQFVAAVERDHPDIIVMDMVMPDMEGIELIRWLTQRQRPAHVIVVTGYNPHYAEMAALMARAQNVLRVTTLSKPVALAQLRKALLDG